ncbi:MAG: M28 family peptidase [archaeon]
MKFDIIKFTKKICSFSPRLGKNENKTAKFIKHTLKENQINYSIQKFKSQIPISKKAFLKADNEIIECKNTSFVSGKIKDKDNLINSYSITDNSKIKYNINYNPYSKAISTVLFYNYPSVAVRYSDLKKIKNANRVFGYVKVKKESYISENILVGNKVNPKYLVFAHYDCHGKTGAIDNASGVSLIMHTIINNKHLLSTVLFVFAGSEEISYDKYDYSCLGFRKFEDKYFSLINNSKYIFILDGVGNSFPKLANKLSLLKDVFLIKSLDKLKNKVYWMHGDINKIKKINHSDIDTIDKLDKKYLILSSNLLINKLKN